MYYTNGYPPNHSHFNTSNLIASQIMSDAPHEAYSHKSHKSSHQNHYDTLSHHAHPNAITSPPHHHVLYTKTETVSVASNHALKLDRLYGAESDAPHKHYVAPRSQSSMANYASSHQKSSSRANTPVSYKPFSTNFKKWIPKYPYHHSMKKVFSKIKQPGANSRKSKVRLFQTGGSPPRSATTSSFIASQKSSKRKSKNRRQVYAVESTYFMDNNLMGEEDDQYAEMSSGVGAALNQPSSLNQTANTSHNGSSIIMNSSYHHPQQYKMRDLPPRAHTDMGMSSARSVSSRGSRKGTRTKKKKRSVFSRGISRAQPRPFSQAQRPSSRAASSMGNYSNGIPQQHYATTGTTRSVTPTLSSSNGGSTMSKGQRSVSSLLRGTNTHIRLENQLGGKSFLKGKSFGKPGTPSKPPPASSRPMYYSNNAQPHPTSKPPTSKFGHRAHVASSPSASSTSSSRSNQENNPYHVNQQAPAVPKPTIQAKPRRSSVALEQTMESTFDSLRTYKFGDQDDSYTNYNGVDLHIDLVMYQFFVSSTTERYRQFDLVEKMVEQVPNLDRISKGIDIESIKRKMRQLADSS